MARARADPIPHEVSKNAASYSSSFPCFIYLDNRYFQEMISSTEGTADCKSWLGN